ALMGARFRFIDGMLAGEDVLAIDVAAASTSGRDPAGVRWSVALSPGVAVQVLSKRKDGGETIARGFDRDGRLTELAISTSDSSSDSTPSAISNSTSSAISDSTRSPADQGSR